MSTINDQNINITVDQGGDSICIIHANCCTDSETPLPIFAGIREPLHHVDIFDRYKPLQFLIFVNQ